MSKITPKNLSYDSTLPPFLARLQESNASSGGRNEFQAARPKKARTAEDEAEDEPVYFDEGSGETLTKSEWEEREAREEGEGEGEKEGAVEGKKMDAEGAREKTAAAVAVAAIGAAKKRKVGRIVGGDEDEEENTTKLASKTSTKDKISKAGEGKKGDAAKGKGMGMGKTAKKGKKIKLSFGDDD
ncbi:hypothetical protein LHYA1_G003886 [Lachnellula hyalina]|uniref:DUF4604 domain-containing protein n=1 Tax=Lachnellula hyalina TaxID=1316788 RepID=A0A8H8R332_9HELO|nr:uncharacterized protein LHYA1_G003886 [Lachnellula hyalina]TVY27613.1 hypothetical protein LHYA1_G003886 [Lachnellula hyalina]